MALAVGLLLPRAARPELVSDSPGQVATAPDAPTPDRADQTIRFGEVPPKTYLDPDFVVSATASSGLPVTFTASGDCAVRGATVRLLSAGKCFVTAHQPGDTAFNAAPDADLRIPIAKASQTIRFPAPASRVYLDPDSQIDALSTSGLPITFFALGSCDVTGTVLQILGAGSCTLTAQQTGDSNFTAAPIVERTLTILRADQTVSFAPIPARVVGKTSFRLSATATSGLPIHLTATGACRLTGATLHLPAEGGSCEVTAQQRGNANFNPSPVATQTFTVVRPD